MANDEVARIEARRLRNVIEELESIADTAWQAQNWVDPEQWVPSYRETLAQLLDSYDAPELLTHRLRRFGISEVLQGRLLSLLLLIESYGLDHDYNMSASDLLRDSTWLRIAGLAQALSTELRGLPELARIFADIDAASSEDLDLNPGR